MDTNVLQADVVVAGGGVGGCAAALAAVESGAKVILTEETDWIGGQFTSQAVPPDEHGWIERFGRTASYQRFRTLVRDHYRRHTPLLPGFLADPLLNPGNAWVSPLAHEPKVALSVLTSMLAPHVAAGRLSILTEHTLVAARRAGQDRLAGIVVEHRRTGRRVDIAARFVIDATELGDLLELSGTEHVTGQEARADTGEPSAPEAARPTNMQAFTWCFAVDHVAGQNHVGAPPENYSRWVDYRFPINPPWPGELLSFSGLDPRSMQPIRYRFAPNPEPQAKAIERTLWTYRRIVDHRRFQPGTHASDIVIINWPMNDYLEKSLIGGAARTREEARAEARQLSLALLHWLRTEAPREDGGKGWPGLRLRPDVTGTADGLAKAAYIREARRIKARCTIREQDVSPSSLPSTADRAREYEDSVGLGYYRIDLHPSHGGDNFIDVPVLPFQIPLGALLPVRMENVLPAAKNIGTTHITNGCYRLHPVEWNIGEAAGALAGFCLEHSILPERVGCDRSWLEHFQAALRRRGVELQWPKSLILEEGDPHAHAT